MTSAQLKSLCDLEKTIPRKKRKATKMSDDLITFIEGDVLDISKTIQEVVKGTLQGLRMEKNTVLGVLSAQLQVLQVQYPQTSTMA